MNYSKEVTDQAREEGTLPPPFLKLGNKVDMGNGKTKVVSTGPHRVKLLDSKPRDGQDSFTKEARKEVAFKIGRAHV